MGAPFQAPQCYVDVNGKRHCLVLPEGQTVCDFTAQRRIERHVGAKLIGQHDTPWAGDPGSRADGVVREHIATGY